MAQVAEFPTINDHVFLFNVFENVSNNVEFKGFWDEKAQYVRTVDHFLGTYLHYSENNHYSWVNFAKFDSADVCVFGKSDPNWKRSINETVGFNFKAYPAGYREVASSSGNKYEGKDEQMGQGFFLTLIQVEDKSKIDELVGNWMSSTGTKQLRAKLEEKMTSVADSNLFRRFGMAPKFELVVRTPAPFEDPELGLQMADELNKMPECDRDGVKITFGYYLVETSYVK